MNRNPIIEFKDFTFKYYSQAKPTLHNINLTIYLGEKILIVGPCGSGKSTLGHCLNVKIVEVEIGQVLKSENSIKGNIDILDVRFGSLWTNIYREDFLSVGFEYRNRDTLDNRVYKNRLVLKNG